MHKNMQEDFLILMLMFEKMAISEELLLISNIYNISLWIGNNKLFSYLFHKIKNNSLEKVVK